jgi:hypothetical protein
MNMETGAEKMSETTLLAVNGTLMRGLELNGNMTAAGGVFVREDQTDPHYRLWSINDCHPGMIRVASGGTAVALEIWRLPLASFAGLLLSEPAGLAIGKVTLQDRSQVLGVLAEPWLVEKQKEITQYGSWRVYTGTDRTKKSEGTCMRNTSERSNTAPGYRIAMILLGIAVTSVLLSSSTLGLSYRAAR